MNTNPHRNSGLSQKQKLHFIGTANSLYRTIEYTEGPITIILKDPALVSNRNRLKYFAMTIPNGNCLLFTSLHQGSIALYIREHNSNQFSNLSHGDTLYLLYTNLAIKKFP